MCTPGKYVGATGSADCIDCIAGKYIDVTGSDEETDCIDCGVGRYVDATGSDECIDCGAGKYSSSSSDAPTDCLNCGLGKYSPAAATAESGCIECTAGKYADVVGSDEASDCIGCAAGKYVEAAGSDDASDCIDCVAGKYIDVTGGDEETDCIDCAAGRFVEVGDSCAVLGVGLFGCGGNCVPLCPHFGTGGAWNDEQSDCIACPAGQYLSVTGSAHLSDCIDCVVGTYVSALGSDSDTDCIGCVAGRSTSSGSTSADNCTECAVGLFASRSGTECVACPINSGTNRTGAASCTCNVGFDRVETTCVSCAALGTCVIVPPSVSLMPLSQPNKVSPTSRLLLRGNVSASGVTRLSWSVWRNSSSGFVDADVMEAGDLIAAALAGRPDAENLVIRSGFLSAGEVYRVRLTATLVGTEVAAQSELTFEMNVPPRNGSVIVTPSKGVALTVNFRIAATGWEDEDTPLAYRFGYDRGAARTWLLANASSDATSALLPQGEEPAGFQYQVFAHVADAFGAASEQAASVTVEQFTKEGYCTWSGTVADKLNSTSDEQTVEVLTGLAVALNSLNTTSADDSLLADLSQTRYTMVETLNASVSLETGQGSVLTEGAVRQVSSTLEAVTLAADQLSPSSVVASAHVLSTITGSDTAPTSLETVAASSLCSVASNLLSALAPDSPTLTDSRGSSLPTAQHISVAARSWVKERFGAASLHAHQHQVFVARETGAELKIVGVLSSVAQAVAAPLVPGEEPVSIKTPAFSMQVEQLSTRSMAGSDRVPVGGGLAELPAAALSNTDVQVQVVNWTRNPFESSVGQQAVGHAGMSMSSSVVTINVRSQSGEPVSDFSEPIRVVLALRPAVRTCSVAYGSSEADNESRRCITPSEPRCSYLDTQAKKWRLDGAVVNRTANSVVCEFTHLTDFAVCLGPPPQPNSVASLRETFDLASFASDNAAGLVMCLVLLALVAVAGARSVRRYFKRMTVSGRDIDGALSQSPYARGLRSLGDLGSCRAESIRLHLRMKWTCGGLLFPLNGDPMDATQRQFVVTSTVMCAMAVNLLFFRLSDHTKYLCEGPSGSNCTDELRKSRLCLCRTFDCNAAGCDGCSACRSLLNCLETCDEWRSNGLLAVLVSSCIVGPIVLSLNSLFKWLHRPVLDTMIGGSASGSTSGVRVIDTSVRQAADSTTSTETETKSGVSGQRRSATSATLPYGYAAVLSLVSIVLIAAVSRRLSSAQTLEWLSYAAASLVLKWALLDPLKVLALAQLQRLLGADQRVARGIACLTALCTGSTHPPRLRETVQLVMRMQAGLDSLHAQMLRAHVQAARERKEAEQAVAHDRSMTEAVGDDVRFRLASMQQTEKEELQAHLHQVETTLSAMLAGQRDPFDCVRSIAGIGQALDADAARTIMRDYNEEANRIAALRVRDHNESLQVRRPHHHILALYRT